MYVYFYVCLEVLVEEIRMVDTFFYLVHVKLHFKLMQNATTTVILLGSNKKR